MSNFKIKYLDNFPVYSYYEQIELPEAVQTGYFYDIVKTENKYEHVYDDNFTNRVIQKIVYETFEVKDIVGKNIDLFKLQGANHVYITPEFGEPFFAVDFDVEYQNMEDNRDSLVIIKFKKQIVIDNQLSSDFAQRMHSNLPVNVLTYSVIKPSYVCHNITISCSAGASPTLSIPLNDLTNKLIYTTGEGADCFYIHSDNTDFNNEVDAVGNHYNSWYCISKTSTTVVFRSNNGNNSTAGFTHTITNLVLNAEPDIWGDSENPEAPINANTITFNLYTFLKPIKNNILKFVEGINTIDGIEENQAVNSKDQLSFKFWLKTEELYKAEYLNYALKKYINIYLTTGEAIKPVQMKDIIIKKENNNLKDLHEFDVTLLYNNKTVNIYR